MDPLENLSPVELEWNQYTLTTVESLSTEDVESNQYTLTKVEELEVAAAILVVFLVIPYKFLKILDVILLIFYQFLEKIVIGRHHACI